MLSLLRQLMTERLSIDEYKDGVFYVRQFTWRRDWRKLPKLVYQRLSWLRGYRPRR